MFILNYWRLALCLSAGAFWIIGPLTYAIFGPGSAQFAFNAACQGSVITAIAFYLRCAYISERVKASFNAESSSVSKHV